MQLSDGLKLLLADLMTPMFALDENDAENDFFLKILEKKGSYRRPKAADRTIQLLNGYNNLLIQSRKATPVSRDIYFVD